MRKISLLGVPLATVLLLGAAGKPTEPAAIVIPAGASIAVRAGQTLDTARNRAGDRFVADLVEPVAVNNTVVLPRGARFAGRITESKPSGRLKGRGVLSVKLESFTFDGKTYRVQTLRQSWLSRSHRNRNLAWIGGGAGGGALVAGLAAGGPWTLAGAGIGAGAGLTTAVITGRKQVTIPAETIIYFRLREPVRVYRRAG
jgi:hypothetical protein